MKSFENIEDITFELKKIGVCNKKQIVGVDGFLGAGKTCLADNIKNNFNNNSIAILDIDDKKKNYYKHNKGSVLKYTNFDKIKKDIMNCKTSIFIVSICLFQIFEKININPDLSIYVKRMAKRVGKAPDSWLDENDCTYKNDVDKWVSNEKSSYGAQLNKIIIIKDVVQYHQRFQPFNKVDYHYLRFEQ